MTPPILSCPSCGSEDAESRRIDECMACGWAQTSPVNSQFQPENEPVFDPEFAEKMQGFKWCGYSQEEMRSMRDHAISSGWKPPSTAGCECIDKNIRLKPGGIWYECAKCKKPETKGCDHKCGHKEDNYCCKCCKLIDLVEEKARVLCADLAAHLENSEFGFFEIKMRQLFALARKQK